MTNWKNVVPLIGVLVLVLIQVGCDGNPTKQGHSAEKNTVEVTNAGRRLSFPEAPDRVVTLNQNGTEMFIALGLEDRMVGTSFRDDPILPRFKDAYENIPVLSEKYPSLEVLLDADPDFVYGFDSAFSPPRGPATVERLNQLGITAYVDRMFYGKSGLDLEDVYGEIRKLGRIFRVRDRADSLVRALRKDVDRVRSRIPSDGDTITAAVYDSGKNSMYTSGTSLVTDMMRTVGARNVFREEIDDSWSPISWEKLVEENPEYIVVMDYGKVTAEDKIAYLEGKTSLQSVHAIKKDNYVILPLSTTFVGVRNTEGVRRLADGFYGTDLAQNRTDDR